MSNRSLIALALAVAVILAGGGLVYWLTRKEAPDRLPLPTPGPKSVAPPPSHPAPARIPAAAIRGRILDAEGLPLPGAEVTLEVLDSRDLSLGGAGHRTAASTQSGADGRFAFDARPAGEAFIRAVAAAHAPRIVPLSGAGGVAGDIALTPGGRVSGGVSAAADGRSLPGTHVIAERIEAIGDRFVRIRAECVSGSDGTFSLGPLAAGAYLLRAVLAGFAEGRASAALEDGETLVRDFVLDKGATIAGRVTDDGGRPIEGVLIRCLAAGIPPDLYESHSDADGAYVVPGVHLGETYAVTAFHPDRASLTHAEVEAGLEGVDFVLPEGVDVGGRVRDAASGAPVKDFTVQLAGPSPRAERALAADGSFRIRHVVPGTYKIEIDAEGYLREPIQVDVGPEGRADIVLSLRRGRTITGMVVDAGTGSPLGGVNVTVSPDDRQGRTQEETGIFAIGGISGGRKIVHAIATGFKGTSLPLEIGREQDPDPIEIPLERR
ncbi:MAG: carboxypeptidase regulatory-like domain-containing protein [Planctomycetes bacterium]|nr:carboxypeptidase regulatory-like domain-containing protein [Planctomycetota bacterium]